MILTVLMFEIDKGQVGNMKWNSEGYPDFTTGEEVVMFLSKDDSDVANPNENYYVLTGMKQGEFFLIEKTSTDKKFGNGKDVLSMSTLKEDISKELEKYKKLPKAADPKVYKP